jgi:hypothetical protein
MTLSPKRYPLLTISTIIFIIGFSIYLPSIGVSPTTPSNAAFGMEMMYPLRASTTYPMFFDRIYCLPTKLIWMIAPVPILKKLLRRRSSHTPEQKKRRVYFSQSNPTCALLSLLLFCLWTTTCNSTGYSLRVNLKKPARFLSQVRICSMQSSGLICLSEGYSSHRRDPSTIKDIPAI